MNKNILIKVGTALALIAIVLPPLLLGGQWIRYLMGIVIALASVEAASLEDGEQHYLFSIVIMIVIGAMVKASEEYVPVVMALYIVGLFFAAIVSEKMTTDRIAYTFIISMIIVLAARGVFRIYDVGFNGLGMLFVAIACYMCDTGAWFFGLSFGKHKMNPRISPNKTWEGAIGGYFTGVITSFLFGYFVQMNYAATAIPMGLMILSAFLLPFLAEVGDLSFSAIKRHWGIKDYGSFLPGHGGILDRVDSLLFCLMVFNALMTIWGFAV